MISQTVGRVRSGTKCSCCLGTIRLDEIVHTITIGKEGFYSAIIICNDCRSEWDAVVNV